MKTRQIERELEKGREGGGERRKDRRRIALATLTFRVIGLVTFTNLVVCRGLCIEKLSTSVHLLSIFYKPGSEGTLGHYGPE